MLIKVAFENLNPLRIEYFIEKQFSMKKFQISFSQQHRIKTDLLQSNMYLVKEGDFVLSGIDARNGAFGIVPKELNNAIVTNDFWCLEPKNEILRKDFFLFITSTSFFDYICKQCSDGTTQRIRLQKDKFLNYEITLPPIDEQEKVVKALTESKQLNKNISNELSHQLDLVKQLRQAFLREAMQGKLTSEWRKQPPELIEGANSATELLKKIKKEKEQLIKGEKIKKQKPLPHIKPEEVPFEIPESWIWCRLGEVCEIKRGKGPKYTEDGVVKMLNQKCVRWFDIEIEHSKAVDKNWYESVSDDCKVLTGDLLVNSTGDGTIGRSALADQKCSGFIFDSHILRVRGYLGTNQALLCSIINSAYGQKLIESLKGATSTKQTELGVNNLSNFRIPLPPLSEQQQIVAKLDQLMSYCDQLEESIKASQQQNELLLQEVLREALEPKTEKAASAKPATIKPEGKMIQLKPRKCDPAERAILAGHIINQTNSEKFGRVKFQKLLYLVEHYCHFDFNSDYIRKPAGPYAGDLIQEVESTLQRFRFYEIKQSQARNHKVNYTPLDAAPELDSIFLENFAKEASTVDEFLLKFKNKDMEQCEIVATLYAVWNNRIIREQPINDKLLKEDFLNWDKQKIKYKDRLDGALEWMRNKNIIPTGWGKEIR